MPLQVVSEMFGLPDSVVRVAEPHWIFAETANWLGITGLLIYRSALLRHDDSMFADVADLLRRHTSELIYQDTITDPGMMFGRGVWEVYLLHTTDEPVEPTDPRVVAIIDLVKNWGEGLHPILVGQEIAKRLESTRSTTS